MSIVRTTPYPSRYVDEEWMDEAEVQNTESPVGKFYLRFDVLKAARGRYSTEARRQREGAEVLALATSSPMRYQRKECYYEVGDWMSYANGYDDCVTVGTGMFDIYEAENVLHVLEALKNAGYAPDDEVTIYFTPEVYDMKLVMNLCNIVEARNTLIVQSLGLSEEIRIIVDEDLAFGIPLNAFSFEKIEACIYLLRQASIMAASTGKARMKPCDGSNPKYQMRSWLLRLGFIGDAFARPRQTLLNGLTGDGAFFSDEGKEKAAVKRKAKRMVG